jgi:hypothetical protein
MTYPSQGTREGAPEPVAWRCEFRGVDSAGKRGPWTFSHYTHDPEEAASYPRIASSFSERRVVPLVRSDTALAAARERIAGELERHAEISGDLGTFWRAAAFVRQGGSPDER